MPSLFKFLQENLRAIFWATLCGFVMSYFIWRGCCQGVFSLFWIGCFTAIMWVSLWLGNAYVSCVLDYFFPWEQQTVTRLIAGLIGMVVYTLSAVYGLIFLFGTVLGFHLGDSIEETYYSTIVITLIITLFMTGRMFFANWRQAAVDAERMKKESVEAQYNNLKNQVNPHFLFNSLNALTNLVYQDQEKAVKFIKQLSDVYRYVLDSRDKEVVSLEEEVKFIGSYAFLQQIRFGDKLKIEVDLVDVKSLVAPLALQMLVENAIKHNEISEEHPLVIKIFKHDNHLVVENTLQRKSVLVDETSGLGLENIKKRYEFLSTQAVKVLEAEGKFIVSIPMIELT
ncbi:MAG: sensor histidine kinase [Cyclobacteriaceae bacterium]|nr:sensor histidine kinase [Cyclobacteriaceae bacterium]